MHAPRNRRVLIIGVLAALFALGGGWLAYLATTSSGGSAAGSNAANAGQPSALASSDGSSSGDTGAPGADSSGGGDDSGPPKPRHNAPTTGIDLQGSGDVTCVTVLPFDGQVEVLLRVGAVRVTSADGVIVGNAGGCSNCVGARLGPGGSGSCQVGVRLSGRSPSGLSHVTVTLTMAATCTDPSRKPCGVATGSSPSRPVAITVIGTHTEDIEVPGAETSESPPVESPESPESPATTDTTETPEAGPSEVSS